MSEFFKVLTANPLGEPYTPSQPGAKPIQSYWCQVEGQEKAVMIGKQVRDDGQPALAPGQHVYGDLMYAKSQKGNEYWKFKSAQVPEGVQRPANSPAQAQAQVAVGSDVPAWFVPYGNMIEFVYKEMQKMADPVEEEPFKDYTKPEPAPLDAETKKVIDDIFGGADDYPDDIGAKG